MASSTSSYYGGSNRLVRIARQWYGHAAGLFMLWTRLGAPWAVVAVVAVVAGGFGVVGMGRSGQLGMIMVYLAVAPLAVAVYAASYVLVRQLPPVPLERLKALDTLLIVLAVSSGAAAAGCLVPTGQRAWLALPALVLAVSAWAINWLHGGSPAAEQGGAALPPPPPFLCPVVGPVTAGYQSYDRSHTGVDIGVAEGTPVVAPAPGAVLHAGPLEQWGYAVWIDHGDGWSSFFAHLERPAARKGATVAAGAVIGWSGTSGISTGPHVHVELRYEGRPVDPEPMRKGAGG